MTEHLSNATSVDATFAQEGSTAAQAAITVYFRPGCGFCTRLQAGLERAGLVYSQVDIWENPDAAAFVRSVARGNETVPTVTIGDTTVVNPSADDVAAMATLDSV